MPDTARYIMIGGFLGAGKSTAVIKMAQWLTERGLRVGLITNDQSVGLVDTALMKSHGHAVQEISGGCFCCRFDSLVEAAEQLTRETTPDVFIAEPVGSCTDLVATVSYPLRRLYGDRYSIAPLSVLADPIRLERILGLIEGRPFSEKVIYVYLKQLEEADVIVINKTDLLDEARLDRLVEALHEKFDRAHVMAVSAREGEGLEDWFEQIQATDVGDGPTMTIDYDQYAEGEAALGWLNATARLSASEPFDGEVLMMNLAENIQTALTAKQAEIAHLKMTLIPDHQEGRSATLNLVNNDFVPEMAQSLPEKTRSGQLILNLRAEADPADLEAIVRQAGETESHKIGTMTYHLEHLECFRPARPEPKWRMSDAQTGA